MGLRCIERVTQIHHPPLRRLIPSAGHQLQDAPAAAEIPEISNVDELQTFVANKGNKFWIWKAVNHKQAGIFAFVIGDRSAATFKLLCRVVKCWQCFFDVTDGWKV